MDFIHNQFFLSPENSFKELPNKGYLESVWGAHLDTMLTLNWEVIDKEYRLCIFLKTILFVSKKTMSSLSWLQRKPAKINRKLTFCLKPCLILDQNHGRYNTRLLVSLQTLPDSHWPSWGLWQFMLFLCCDNYYRLSLVIGILQFYFIKLHNLIQNSWLQCSD